MTDPSVWYAYDYALAIKSGFDNVDLRPYISDITVRADIDQTPWGTATITCENLPLTAIPTLIPQGSPSTVSFRIYKYSRDYTGAPIVIDSFPGTSLYTGSPTQTAVMYVRKVDIQHGGDVVTIELATGEAMLMDKHRIAGTTLNTGATNVENLVLYSLTDVFGAYAFTDPINAGAVSIPSGDRRLMLQGDSHWDLIEPELNAAGGRLFGDWSTGLSFAAADRNDPPRDKTISTVFLSTYNSGIGDLATELSETYDRDSDYADGVLVKYDYDDASGVNHTAYQASGAGVNTRGVMITYNRPPSSANLANQIVARTAVRGHTITVENQIAFTVRPGYTLVVARPAGATNFGMIRSVEWRTSKGDMTVTSQIGIP